MGKYLVKILPTDECNKDFWPLKEMMDGIECDGFLCTTQSNEKPYLAFLMNMSAEILEDSMKDRNNKTGVIMRCAAICADAHLRAADELKRANIRDQIEEMLQDAKKIQ